ncbi:UDP-N-acetylmuramoyl-L-alanyl-D-glutamate--2,6-diaminopimelate ligase [Petroclostridium sp. X23]|uniref:UDP-N-acetylmuramoyl-L-alanyl-D-glutamate--2, 6-diaminopimelate ligase n=1 Tax=Petroclostridium sp. X23 TaxID=3045146 RepID=UPI0024AD21DC|nr:UDP-N-acetylmuramoyl-L-alanyl-D-glutamate--2,6-diaminopimelate ligase [Petroclostridium sp. X23]WHH58888.1 UDP-N-acetylmuramoyl-L-alanyl-D-glutamate--2,6-diaminopimelate ligase [Petroclostridium sp. X23]
MRLDKLIKAIEPEIVLGDRNVEISGIAYDSRKVNAGDLFVCIKGFKVDGHEFISQAIESGAAAIVSEKEITGLSVPLVKVNNSRRAMALISAEFYDHPSTKFNLVGITGTNGKTTTTYLIKTILEQQGRKVGLIGTNQNMIGDRILPTERTTPESMELQKLFAEMVIEDVDDVVIEVSSHSLELNRVDGCHFEVGVFTNITQDHLDFHLNMENYLKAKTKLFQRCKIGIINCDDTGSTYILENGTCKMMTFGIEQGADIKATELEITSKGVGFQTITPEGECRIHLSIPGRFSIYNALGSIGACMALGVDLNDIKQGLKVAKGVPGRAQIVETGKDFMVLIDYAHTPDGLKNILSAVKGFVKGRVVTLFGCGGDRDKTKRPIMGRIAGAMSDFCIVTSDNPRTEDPMQIILQIEEGVKGTECPYIIIENRYEAIEYALRNAQEDDVIVLAGKGHETYQEINGKKYPFDENEIVKEILSKN